MPSAELSPAAVSGLSHSLPTEKGRVGKLELTLRAGFHSAAPLADRICCRLTEARSQGGKKRLIFSIKGCLYLKSGFWLCAPNLPIRTFCSSHVVCLFHPEEQREVSGALGWLMTTLEIDLDKTCRNSDP